MVDPNGMIADFYNSDGKWLGTDGINDNKIYVTNELVVSDNTSYGFLVDWNSVISSSGTRFLGFRNDFLNMNGYNISSESLVRNLIGLSIFMARPMYSKIDVTSGDSGKLKNARIGGARKSRHLEGDAADITVNGISNYQLSQFASNSKLFSAVIFYPDYGITGALGAHVHVDLRPKGGSSLIYIPRINFKNFRIQFTLPIYNKSFDMININIPFVPKGGHSYSPN